VPEENKKKTHVEICKTHVENKKKRRKRRDMA
jgi:hypothetical protein